ncbi:MAG TPA: agmatinase [Longimicrobiaceae bacterium]|jgi:agmatinase|nr:agmatinase [Longimicrobiaceae bacterium]
MSDLPESLRSLAWELPHNFLGLEAELAAWESAGVVILPVPYEATVSYQGGTGNGPAAILEASRYIELYDQELDSEPAEIGIATLPALELSGAGPETAVRELREAYDQVLDAAGERLVIALGGEHSLSSAPILAHAARMPEGKRLSVLQLDAHSDLRLEYEGSPYSHASVMARVIDDVDLVAVGIRALTREERELIRSRESIKTIFAEETWRDQAWIDRTLAALGDTVYITFDVDYFDPSLIPATGTPEPGGAAWYPTMELLRRVFAEKTVVGIDVVELAPIPGNAAPDFAVAKLVYKMIGYYAAARAGGGKNG